MKQTISDSLSLIKVIRKRIDDLGSLRGKVAVRETFFNTSEKQVVPQYDVKSVDKKITKLEEMKFRLDNAIKMSNSLNMISTDIDPEEIFAPLE